MSEKLPKGWKRVKLGEVGKVITGTTPSKNNPDYWGNDILFVTPTDYKNYNKWCYDSERKLSTIGEKALKNKLLPPKSIMVTCIGSDMGKVAVNFSPAITNQQINSIIINESKAYFDFIYYLIKSMEENLKVLGHSGGSALPILNKSTFENIEIIIPEDIPEQRAIASVLSSLDDKIDLLHRQNKTLEQMAETLFRQWFVEEADESWEEVKITDLYDVRDGTHDSPKKKEFGKNLITSKHLKNNYLDFDSAYLISEEDYMNINKRSKVDMKDILFSMIGTIGNVYIEESDEINYAIKNIGLFKTSQNTKFAYFTYLWLKSDLGKEFIHEYKSGSTQEYISLGSLRNIIFKIPSMEQIFEFDNIVKDYFSKIKTNQTQIRTLEKLRDTLLPKLMSGEVRVKVT